MNSKLETFSKLYGHGMRPPKRWGCPKVCRGCRFIDSEWNERTDVSTYYCRLNVFLPWRKNTCKRRQERTEQ